MIVATAVTRVGEHETAWKNGVSEQGPRRVLQDVDQQDNHEYVEGHVSEGAEDPHSKPIVEVRLHGGICILDPVKEDGMRCSYTICRLGLLHCEGEVEPFGYVCLPQTRLGLQVVILATRKRWVASPAAVLSHRPEVIGGEA